MGKSKQVEKKADRFSHRDMVWLAEEFERQINSNPSLTLEEFAVQYGGVPVNELRAYATDADGSCVTLWHGTTKSLAELIRKEGFRARDENRRIFFTENPYFARAFAVNKAKHEGGRPAVIMCSIDLNNYDSYQEFAYHDRTGRTDSGMFAFNHKHIANDVVRKVDVFSDDEAL